AARADKLLNAQKAMVSSFNNPTGGGLASLGSGNLAGGLLKGGGSGQNALANAGKRGDGNGSGKNGAGSGSGAGGFKIPKPNYDMSYNSGSGGSGSGSGGGGMSAEQTKANDRIEEAIEYRDQNPEDWKNKNGDTLWKIITRSYIRNYDKLLRKRKKRISP
ncbi:MAG: hypothetical protein KC493_10385, partial [Bacteriovoracaceae bacterium]|nr:hypothetical protein [Bacteriovoracaceae bacterium]